MSDSRFKFLVVSVCVTLIAIVALWRFSNPVFYKTSSDTKVGKYVYWENRRDVLHTDRKCKKLSYKGVDAERVELAELSKAQYIPDFCNICISDKDYEKLLKYFPDHDR